MNTTLMLKLVPADEQRASLLRTMERFNEACNYIAGIAFEQGTANKIRLQQVLYYEVRRQFGLTAQLAIRAIAKVCEAFKRNRTKQPTFRPHGAVPYDQRILRFRALDQVSIQTLDGRQVIPLVLYGYAEERLREFDRRGQTDLIYRDGEFYLAVVVDIPEPPPEAPNDFLGVDFGIVNLATDSDGEVFSGEAVDRTRCHYERRRRSLQKVGTKRARWRLKKTKSRERRFKRQENHVISKRLVAKAKGTSCGIAIENLKGIRERTTVRRAERTRHGKWAFAELRSFVEYKAALAGVLVVSVDPRNTSKGCSECGTVDRRNRPDQSTFLCVGCGFRSHADLNAALNIKARGLASGPMVSADAARRPGQGQATGIHPLW